METRRGPNTEPWGTPRERYEGVEDELLTVMDWNSRILKVKCETNRELCTATHANSFRYLRSFSSTDFINPFLSLSLVNMSSDRAVFITYSSALVMSVMELRRRQGTRCLSVARVLLFPASGAYSLFGVQGCICILSSRGRMFRRIWGGHRVRGLSSGK